MLDHVLGNLQGVESSAFANLVAADPEVQAVLDGLVLADAADFDIVLAGREERHRVDLLGRVVANDGTREGVDGLAGRLNADLILELDVDGLGVAAVDRGPSSP